jgi:hypothetical protein
MWAVWLRVRSGMRQDWRGPVVLALITGLMGAVVLVALAGARRTDSAVSRFVQYAGPIEGQVTAEPRTMDRIAALPSVAYSARCPDAGVSGYRGRAHGGIARPGDHMGPD